MPLPCSEQHCLCHLFHSLLLQAEVWPAESIQNWKECWDVWCYWRSTDPGVIDRHKYTHTHTSPHRTHHWWIHTCVFVCLQNNSMSLPVVYLDPMLDQELASRLTAIITKHQVKSCRVLKMSRQRVRWTDFGEDVYTVGWSIHRQVWLIIQFGISATGSQFVLPQGTLSEDRTLASHHIYPLAASTEEGELQFMYVCTVVIF